MEKEDVVSVRFPCKGYIEWFPDESCGVCGKKGIFSGYNLECDKFYEYATVDYCPTCFSVNVIGTDIYFSRGEQKKFLPIMKEKLKRSLNLRSGIKEAGPCPECGGSSYSYKIDLGIIDYWDNKWTVCPNPDCNWPGDHEEKWTTGLW